MDVEYIIGDTEYDIEDETYKNTIIGYNYTFNLKEQLENMEYGE